MYNNNGTGRVAMTSTIFITTCFDEPESGQHVTVPKPAINRHKKFLSGRSGLSKNVVGPGLLTKNNSRAGLGRVVKKSLPGRTGKRDEFMNEKIH